MKLRAYRIDTQILILFDMLGSRPENGGESRETGFARRVGTARYHVESLEVLKRLPSLVMWDCKLLCIARID